MTNSVFNLLLCLTTHKGFVVERCQMSQLSILIKQLLSLNILPSPFSSSTIFQSSPITSAPIFLVSMSLSHLKQCYEYPGKLKKIAIEVLFHHLPNSIVVDKLKIPPLKGPQSKGSFINYLSIPRDEG